MIRKARPEDLSALHPDSEAAVKIRSLVDAYGMEQPFLQLWCIADDHTPLGFVSLLDKAGIVSSVKSICFTDEVAEETAIFLSMQTDMQSIRTSMDIAERLMPFGEWKLECGTIMTPGASLGKPRILPDTLSPREMYPILVECFGNNVPAFSPWYVDVSYKMRHGFCRMAGIRENNEPVACAMTTAECEGAAVIGAVATLPSGRKKGYASSLVLSLANECIGEKRRVFLSPKNENAHTLYSGLGFVNVGKWANLCPLNIE